MFQGYIIINTKAICYTKCHDTVIPIPPISNNLHTGPKMNGLDTKPWSSMVYPEVLTVGKGLAQISSCCMGYLRLAIARFVRLFVAMDLEWLQSSRSRIPTVPRVISLRGLQRPKAKKTTQVMTVITPTIAIFEILGC